MLTLLDSDLSHGTPERIRAPFSGGSRALACFHPPAPAWATPVLRAAATCAGMPVPISYDSESALCKLLDELGFSLLEAPNKGEWLFLFRKHLHRLKCNRERCTRPNSSADAKAASTPMANGTTFKLPAHCRLLTGRLWLPTSNHVREDQGYENEDRDQARTLQPE